MVAVDLDKSKLRAPYDALVARRLADEGQVLAAGAPVFDLVEIDHPRVRLGVPPEVLGELAPGRALTVEVAGQARAANVFAVLPERGERTRTVDVLLELSGTLAQLRAGDHARLRLARTVAADGFWLPISALAESTRGLWSCLVAVPLAGQEGTAAPATHQLESRQLEVLVATSASGDAVAAGASAAARAYVRGALDEGELVVASGLQRVVPGQRVRLAATAGAAAPGAR
jgi:hypothetical protein